MLYRRYGDPTALLNQLIRNRKLSDYLDDLLDILQEEMKDKTMWEFFLAKVEGKTYAEFLGEVERTEPNPVDMEQVEVTVQKSMNILENFSLN